MILDDLAAASRRRVSASKAALPLPDMISLALARPEPPSLYEALRKPGLSFLCEVKKASPSKGIIAPHFPYLDIAREYEEAGAAAISVLTEPDYFMGSNDYLAAISETVSLPLLRKDFTVDAYQIYEAKALGASAVLLICALLPEPVLCDYLDLCQSLHLDALVEAHDEPEIDSAVRAGARIIGVNNRNLKTFEVDISNAIRLRSRIPASVLYVAESGIQTQEEVRSLEEAGADAVLIGETLMRASNKKALLDSWRTGGPI